ILKDFFVRLWKEKYGMDILNYVLVVLIVLFTVLYIKYGKMYFTINAIFVFFLLLRFFAKNHRLRILENEYFINIFKRFVPKRKNKTKDADEIIVNNKNDKRVIKDGKIFFKCKYCNQTLRIPMEKGRIVVTCPKCKREFEMTTHFELER
nr:hypothetical protein [Lachnospiraceae bacterium]